MLVEVDVRFIAFLSPFGSTRDLDRGGVLEYSVKSPEISHIKSAAWLL